MRARVLPLFGLALVLAGACGGSAFSNDESTGGSGGAQTGTGSSSATGGAVESGGTSSAGSSAGGVVGDGGVSAKGGTTATGGSSGKGGSVGTTGGLGATGGATATGGAVAQGGTGKGGSSAQGGTGKGGSISSGGTTANGGSGGVVSGGASATGGAVSAGGAAGAGAGGNAGGNAGSSGVCRLDSDCRISEDCCSCFAAAPGEPTIVCKSACKQTACAAAGIAETEATCVAGRCVLARSCTPSTVQCDAVAPTCDTGELPSIKGGCWGPCLAVGECSDVPSCKVCEEAGLSCVTIEANAAPVYHCVSKPSACDKNPTCNCMGVCLRPYQCSAPSSTALTCTCPTC